MPLFGIVSHVPVRKFSSNRVCSVQQKHATEGQAVAVVVVVDVVVVVVVVVVVLVDVAVVVDVAEQVEVVTVVVAVAVVVQAVVVFGTHMQPLFYISF